MSKAMSYTQARDLLLEQVAGVEAVSCPLSDCAGRILAQTVTAVCDVPPFDRSPYDGYAFCAADTQNADEAPVTLRILEEIPAGSMWSVPVTPGTASKILTGAPIPLGADAVCMYEKTAFTDETVTIPDVYRSGDNVVRRGADVVAGQLLAREGCAFDGALIGTLAAQGNTAPLVYRRARAGVITTGSELEEAGERLTGGKIINTNRYTFVAELSARGLQTDYYGHPSDSVAEISAALEQALSQCDVVVVTGGVSVGDYDLTPAALKHIGAEILVQNVALKPGGKCCYAMRGGKLICCLSGNPASALTNFYAVALPAIRKICGHNTPKLPEISVRLAQPFAKKSPKTRLLRGRLCLNDGPAEMQISGAQGNGVLHTMIGCDLLAIIPAGSPALPQGTILTAYRLI